MMIYETVEGIVKSLNNLPRGQKVLKEYDRIIIIEPTDASPFYVEIKGGRASLVRGKPSIEDPLLEKTQPLRGTERDLVDLFQGKVRLIDAIWEGKIRTFIMNLHINYWITKLIKAGMNIEEVWR